MIDTPVRALALVGRGYLAMWSGDLILAERMGKEAVEIFDRLGFDEGLSMAKLGYGTTLINLGRDREAYPHLVDAVELFDQQNNTFMKGTVLVHLANVSLGLGDPAQALKSLDMAMPYMQQSGDIWGMAFLLNNFGEVARTQGEYEKAEGFYRRTDELFQQADAKGDQARLVHTFGYIAMHKGSYDESRSLFLESLDDFLKLGNHRGIAECLAGLAGLAVEQGNHAWAAPLLSAAESLLQTIDGAWWPADRVEIERAREQMQTALGDRFHDLWLRGQSMKVDEAIAYVTAGV
jgi:tetratricopeptide (TPR) repeat protein